IPARAERPPRASRRRGRSPPYRTIIWYSSALPRGSAGARGRKGTALRVALLTYRGNPYSGGQGVYVRALSRALRDAGHRVTVLSGPPYAEVDRGVRLMRVPSIDYYASLPPGREVLRRIRRPVDLVEFAGASVGVFPEPLTFGMRAYRYLRAHRDDFDVVHDNQSLSYGLLAVQRLGLPV